MQIRKRTIGFDRIIHDNIQYFLDEYIQSRQSKCMYRKTRNMSEMTYERLLHISCYSWTRDLLMLQKSWQPVDMDRTSHMFFSWFHYLNWHNCRISEPSTRYDRCIKRKIITDRLSVLYIQVFSTKTICIVVVLYHVVHQTSPNLNILSWDIFHFFI